jgi:hypothetical protein
MDVLSLADARSSLILAKLNPPIMRALRMSVVGTNSPLSQVFRFTLSPINQTWKYNLNE